MSEGMSAERLAEIRALIIQPTSDDGTPFAFLSRRLAAAVELLAEVERLRSRAKTDACVKSLAKSLIRSYKEQRDELRARLDEIGETREEYAVRNEGHEAFCATAQGALRIAKEWTAARPGAPWQANRRLVGEWREVPDA